MHGTYEALDANRTSAFPVASSGSSSTLNAGGARSERRMSAAMLMMDVTAGVGVSRDLGHSEFDPDQWWETLSDAVARGMMVVTTCNSGKQAREVGCVEGGETKGRPCVRAITDCDFCGSLFP